MWNDLKNNSIGRKVISTPKDLNDSIIGQLRMIQKTAERVRSYFSLMVAYDFSPKF